MLLTGLAVPADAASRARSAHSEAALLSDHRSVEPGQDFQLALLLRPDKGWHTYWKNPGDSGAAPILKWSLPPGVRLAPPAWQTPERLRAGPLVNFGYDGESLLLFQAFVSPEERGALPLRLEAEWLVCQEECVPARATLELRLPVGASAAEPAWERLRARHEDRFPRGGLRVSALARGGSLALRFPGEAVGEAFFFPEDGLLVPAAAEQPLAKTKDGWELTLRRSGAVPQRLAGILAVDGGGFLVDAPVSVPAEAPWAAMALAFLGGLLLNLMPCVLPVLSIKVLGFIESGADRARAHGLAYGAGVLASFWLLAAALLLLRGRGVSVGWGFQLQSPWVSGALAALFLALALNLLGAFELGAAATRLGRLSGRGAFLSGMLATVVATPCTAPFMGTALGAAVLMPAPAALAVFTALGAGMAAPYVLLSFFPAGLRLLPKPGAWMETLKQALAFPLLATSAWLFWVLGRQTGLVLLGPLAAAACALAFLAWLWRRFGRRAAGAGAAVLTAALLALRLARPPALPWQPYTEARLEEALSSGRGAFVDFTAAWCVTCQVNERVAFAHPKGRAALLGSGLVLLKADWTSRDPAISSALERLGRAGVPVYAVHLPGEAPRLLPSLLTPELLVEQLPRKK